MAYLPPLPPEEFIRSLPKYADFQRNLPALMDECKAIEEEFLQRPIPQWEIDLWTLGQLKAPEEGSPKALSDKLRKPDFKTDAAALAASAQVDMPAGGKDAQPPKKKRGRPPKNRDPPPEPAQQTQLGDSAAKRANTGIIGGGSVDMYTDSGRVKILPIQNIEPFDFRWMTPDMSVICCGKRRTGKSFFAREMLYHMRNFFSHGLVFTNTEMNGFWQHHIPSRFVIPGFKPDKIDALIEEQKALREAGDEFAYKFIILDDVGTSPFRRLPTQMRGTCS